MKHLYALCILLSALGSGPVQAQITWERGWVMTPGPAQIWSNQQMTIDTSVLVLVQKEHLTGVTPATPGQWRLVLTLQLRGTANTALLVFDTEAERDAAYDQLRLLMRQAKGPIALPPQPNE